MNFGNLKKLAADFSTGLRIYNFSKGIRSSCAASVLNTSKINNPHLNEKVKLVSLCKSEIFCFTFPQIDAAIRKNIIELPKVSNISYDLPIRNSQDTALDFPFHIEKEITEPRGRIISKKARHIISIRRRKMRRHKLRKLRRKNRAEIFKKKLKVKMEKEYSFDNSLKNICSSTNSFSAEKYLNETLEKVHWQRPITRVRGFLAPKWVIKNYLEEEEEKRLIKERIKDCLK